jgi:hypothetical protein
VGNDVNGGTGGGTYNSILWNCIAYDNLNAGNDVEGGSASFTCLPTLSVAGVGNFTNAPSFVKEPAGGFRLAAGSPCINAGTNQDWMIGALALAGLPRIASGTVDMGAYEFQGGGVTIGFSALTDLLRLHLEWPSVTGTSYQLQTATDLPTTNWLNEGAPFNGTGGMLQTNLPVGTKLRSFFRLQLLNN